MPSNIDFAAINAAALSAYPSLLQRWLPAGKLQGREYRVGDLSGAPGESLAINIDTGRWSDFANPEKSGGDPISLYAARCNLKQGEAARELAQLLAMPDAAPMLAVEAPKKGKPTWTPICPVPAGAPAPMASHHVHGEPAAVWTYRDAAGSLLGHVYRFNLPDGGKEVLPQCYAQCEDGRKGWRWVSFPKPRPLYGLDLLAANPAANVCIVEGEKAADAARVLFPSAVVVTWPGGGKAVKHADWTPLAGRKVVIWPDWDLKEFKEPHPRAGQLMPWLEQPGVKTGLEIAGILRDIAAGVRLLMPPRDRPADGWDAFDAVAEGWTAASVTAWLPTALRMPEEMRAELASVAQAPEPLRYRDEPEPSDTVHEVDTAAPLTVGRVYIQERSGGPNQHRNLVYWQGEFFRARQTHYEMLPTDALKAELYHFLEQKHADGRPIKPTKRMVENVLDALKAVAILDVHDAPAWLDGCSDGPAAGDLIACGNGLLDVTARTLLPPTRLFFGLNALDFDYVLDAPEPYNWLGFVRDLWGEDHASIDTLQEIFGLALTGDTRHQKAFLLIGPRRSGKGTVARILTSLVGVANVTAPTISSLGLQFGLESMIGKTLAVISDARLGGRADISAIAENLLRITGEDTVSVHRKFRTDWTARLRVRFVILSNELPAFLDQSGALAGRFIVLRLTRSFFGNEDLGLTQRLLGELPGILNWALAGLDRLRDRGHFVQPPSALEMVRQLETLGSPIKNFVAERCIVMVGASVGCVELFEAWAGWTREQGRDHPGSLQIFGRNLAAAFPEIAVKQHMIDGRRSRFYEGIRLRWLGDPD